MSKKCEYMLNYLLQKKKKESDNTLRFFFRALFCPHVFSRRRRGPSMYSYNYILLEASMR